MKKTFVTFFLSFACIAGAQQRVPATMVQPDGGAWGNLPDAVTLQIVLDYIDGNIGSSSYAPNYITTNAPTTVSPRWIGDFLVIYATNRYNTKLYFSTGNSTSDWRMVYPVMANTSTNAASSTNTLPRDIGDSLYIRTATTQEFWTATSLTNWTKVTGRAP